MNFKEFLEGDIDGNFANMNYTPRETPDKPGDFISGMQDAMDELGYPVEVQQVMSAIFMSNNQRWASWWKEFTKNPKDWIGKKYRDWKLNSNLFDKTAATMANRDREPHGWRK